MVDNNLQKNASFTEGLDQKQLGIQIGISVALFIPFLFCCSLWTIVFYIGLFRLLTNAKYLFDTAKEYLLTKKLDLGQRYGKGSYVLITGGANGIGLEYAKQFSLLGFNLILVDLDQEGLDKAKNEISSKRSDVDVIVIKSDMTKLRTAEELKNVLSEVLEKDISILINNVGVASALPFHEASTKIINDMVHLNSNTLVTLTSILSSKLSLRTKDSEYKSAIINMCSSSSFYPVPIFFLYSMTKAFVKFFSESLEIESTPGIDIMNACPGFVSTYMTCHREDSYTITTDVCVTNILRSLGQYVQTEVTLNTRLMVALLFQAIWYISPLAILNIVLKLNDNTKGKELIDKIRNREKQQYK